jgi:hypothetical protein
VGSKLKRKGKASTMGKNHLKSTNIKNQKSGQKQKRHEQKQKQKTELKNQRYIEKSFEQNNLFELCARVEIKELTWITSLMLLLSLVELIRANSLPKNSPLAQTHNHLSLCGSGSTAISLSDNYTPGIIPQNIISNSFQAPFYMPSVPRTISRSSAINKKHKEFVKKRSDKSDELHRVKSQIKREIGQHFDQLLPDHEFKETIKNEYIEETYFIYLKNIGISIEYNSHLSSLLNWLQKIPKLDVIEQEYLSLLSSAIHQDDAETLRYLNQLRAVYTDLEFASRIGSLNLIDTLMDEGKDIFNLKYRQGNSELHIVILGLIAKDSNFYAPTSSIVFFEAESKRQRVIIIKKLISHGSHVNSLNNKKQTALSLALDLDWFEAVKLLLDLGADPNIGRLDNGKKPSLFMLQNKKYKKLLLNDTYRSQPNQEPEYKQTENSYFSNKAGILMFAATAGAYLLYKKRVIDKQNPNDLRPRQVNEIPKIKIHKMNPGKSSIEKMQTPVEEIENLAQKLEVARKSIDRTEAKITGYNKRLKEIQSKLDEDAISRNKIAKKINKLKEYSINYLLHPFDVNLKNIQDSINLENQNPESDTFRREIGNLEKEIAEILTLFSAISLELENEFKRYENWAKNQSNKANKVVEIKTKSSNFKYQEEIKIEKILPKLIEELITKESKFIQDKESKKTETGAGARIPLPKVASDKIISLPLITYKRAPDPVSKKTRIETFDSKKINKMEKAEENAMQSYLQLSSQLSDLKYQELESEISRDIYKLALAYYVMRTFNALFEMCKVEENYRNYLTATFGNFRNRIVKCVLKPEIDINNFSSFCFDICDGFENIYRHYQNSGNLSRHKLVEFCNKIKNSQFNNDLELLWENYQTNKGGGKTNIQSIKTLIAHFEKMNQILKVITGKEELSKYPDRVSSAKALIVDASQIFFDLVEKKIFFQSLTEKNKIVLKDFFENIREKRNIAAHSSDFCCDIETNDILSINSQFERNIIPILKPFLADIESINYNKFDKSPLCFYREKNGKISSPIFFIEEKKSLSIIVNERLQCEIESNETKSPR